MLKDDILKLLKEDAEFRKQVEEILGISFINVTLADLKDILKGLLASMDKLKSSVDQLVDAQRRAEERIAKLENAVEQLVEAQKRTDERITKLEEVTMKLVESQLGMQNEIRELRKALGSMGKRWGRDFEKLIIEIVDELAKQEGLDLKYVNKFTYKDDNGLFGLKGVEYDVDLLIKDTKVYLIEIKSYVEKDDVNWAAHKFNVIEKALGLKNTIKMIFAVDATNLATKKGEELGIKVVYGSQSEEEEKGEVKVG